MCTNARFTVFFEDPFWVGVFERVDDDKLEVSKIVFGAEPKDYEVYEYLLKHYTSLKFSPPVDIAQKSKKKINPKRMQRQILRELSKEGIGTRSQQALKLQQQEGKEKRTKFRKEKREAEEKKKFELKREKKKEKKKGR